MAGTGEDGSECNRLDPGEEGAEVAGTSVTLGGLGDR